jgi:hypothetical protein
LRYKSLLLFFFLLINLIAFSQSSITKFKYSSKAISIYNSKKINDSTIVSLGYVNDDFQSGVDFKGFILITHDTIGNIEYNTSLFYSPAFSNYPNVNSFVVNSRFEYTLCGSYFISGNENILLTKISSPDSILWVKTYEVNHVNIVAEFINEEADKSLIIIGTARSDTSFHNFPFFLKVDSIGNIVWFKSVLPKLNNTFSFFSKSIKSLNGGYITATSYNSKLLLIKCDTNGRLEILNSEALEQLRPGIQIFESANGEIYFLSHIQNPLINHGSDILVGKMDTLGDISWAKIIGNEVENFPNSLLIVKDNIFIVGHTENLNNLQKYQGIIFSINDSGQFQWAKKLINPFGKDDISGLFSFIFKNESSLLLGGLYEDEFANGYGVFLSTDFYGLSECESDSIMFYQMSLFPVPFSLTLDTISLTANISTCNIQKIAVQLVIDNECIQAPIVPEYKIPDITIYPNPTSGLLYLNIVGEHHSKHINVFNTVGQKIIDKDLDSTVLDISNFAEGVYILNYFSDEKTYTIKVIKY